MSDSKETNDMELEGLVKEPVNLQVEDVYAKLAPALSQAVRTALESHNYSALQGKGYVIKMVGLASADPQLSAQMLKDFAAKLEEVHAKYEIRGNLNKAVKLDLVEPSELSKGLEALSKEYQPRKFVLVSYVAIDPDKAKAFDTEVKGPFQ